LIVSLFTALDRRGLQKQPLPGLFAAVGAKQNLLMAWRSSHRVISRLKNRFAVGHLLTISREESRFFAQLTGQSKIEIFPESERDYFLKAVDAQFTFEVDGEGRTRAVVLHQNGRDQRAIKMN
jgi:hypothetical protein